jgi:hypothetical protein
LKYTIYGERNPKFECLGFSIETLGDPHLGRVFKNNVPKSKLGIREESVFNEFRNRLFNTTSDYFVVMGDLFDKSVIKHSVLLDTIETITKAVQLNPDVKYIILAGNHDLSKDKTLVSSFQVLTTFLKNKFKNLYILSDEKTLVYNINNLLFFPYNPYEQVTKNIVLNLLGNTLLEDCICFGHWDTTDFSLLSGTTSYHSNLIPDFLIESKCLVVTGHEHKPKQNGSTYVTGSMQPYAHGEQLDTEPLYVTHEIQDVLKNLESSSNYYSNSNVRVLLTTSDAPPSFDCLSFSVKYKTMDSQVEDIETDTEVDQISSNSPLSFSALFYQYINEKENSIYKYISTCFLDKTYTAWDYTHESN